MSVVQQFCARESLAVGDPLAGSAAHAEHNLLLSWPRAKWRRSLRQASDMPGAVSARLEAIAESGRRVNLINRRDQSPDRHRLYLMPENRRFDVSRDELPALLQALETGDSLARWEVAPPEGPLLLCCTHGKKDKCCAKFGHATYQALAAAVADRGLPFEVWESTHLGGCRLAASAVVFPALRKYGRINAEDVVPLLESEAANHPYLPCYRGDSRLSPLQQCAQVAGLTWLQARGLAAEVDVEDAVPYETETQCELAMRWQSGERQGRLHMTCRATDLIRHDTCADFQGDGAKPVRVWHVTSIISC